MKNGGHLLEGCATIKYAAIKDCQAEFPVSRLCAVLKVTESRYYAWLNRGPSPPEQENRELEQTICTVWKQYRGIYGAPRIHAEFQEQRDQIRT